MNFVVAFVERRGSVYICSVCIRRVWVRKVEVMLSI